jgi:hypothetical protein
VLLTGQGVLTSRGTQDFGALKSGEEIIHLSHGGSLDAAKIQDLVLSRQEFAPLGFEFSKGVNTVCHPDLPLLCSMPFGSMTHLLLLVDCEHRGYGVAQFERLPISLEETPLHFIHKPGTPWVWQKLWVLDSFPNEESRILQAHQLSLSCKIPILSSPELDDGVLSRQSLEQLLEIQDATGVRRTVERLFNLTLKEPELLTVTGTPGNIDHLLGMIVGNIQGLDGIPEFELQIVSPSHSHSTESHWRKIGMHLLSHRDGFESYAMARDYLASIIPGIPILCLLRFQFSSRLYRVQKASHLIPGVKVLGIENSKLVERTLLKKVSLPSNEQTCMEIETGEPSWFFADRLAVASKEWGQYFNEG